VRAGLPVEPILGFSAAELARQMAARLGGTAKSYERAIYRARARGWLRTDTADKVAISLGTHPVVLWGPAWEQSS
jgi:hypothetical protein